MMNMKLTRNEINECQKLFEQLSKDGSLLNEKLTALQKNPEEVCAQISEGVDEFYSLYNGEVNSAVIRKQIRKAIQGKTPLQTYSYLANLMTALSHIGAKVFNEEVWSNCLVEHQNILKAIEMGLITEDDLHVTDGIENMMEIISENIEAFAVLFVDNPDLAELQEACLTEDADKVKAIALNTHKAAVNMAAAIYVMQEEGKLSSLKDTRYSPRDMGVMSASLLEIDAAQKSGSMETLKKVFQKASRTAVTLLLASPAIVLSLGVMAIIGMLTNFATIWMIVSGVAIGINLKAHYQILADTVSPVFALGAKVLEVTLDKVKPMFAKLSGWVQNTVAPNVMPVWQKCCIFTRERIIIPAVTAVLKTKNFVQNALTVASQKAADAYAHAADWVRDVFAAAKKVAETENIYEAEAEPTVDTDIEPEFVIVDEVETEVFETEIFETEEAEVEEDVLEA